MADPPEPPAAMTRLSAAVTIAACTVSAGLLPLPSAFAQAYLGPTLILSALSAVITGCSLQALAIVHVLSGEVEDGDKGVGRRVEGYGPLTQVREDKKKAHTRVKRREKTRWGREKMRDDR